MPSQRNIDLLSQTADRMRSASAIYFTDFKGLGAGEATELRAILRENNIDYFVVKKTLSRLAAAEAGVGDISEFLVGQVGMAFARDEPTAPARILKEFRRAHTDIPAVTGIYLDGQKLSATRMEDLANLPKKEVLLSQLLSALQSPLTRLAQTLSAPMSRLGLILSDLKDKKTS